MVGKITDKNLKNKRFKKTEKSIIKAYLLLHETLSLERLIKTAHISRSTLYRHHKNIYQIVPDYEKFILTKYNKFAKKLIRIKYFRLKDLYEQTFNFLCRYQEIAEFLLQCSNRNFTEELLFVLKPKIIATGKVGSGEVLDIYLKEVATLIEAWQQNGLQATEIPTVVDKIMYLTDTADLRLGPLAKFDHPKLSQSSESSTKS